MTCIRVLITGILLVLCFAGAAAGEVPQLINYQGRLTSSDGSPVADGTYNINFQIFEHDPPIMGENPLWQSGYQPVEVTDGIFVHLLGSATPLPASVFNDDNLDSYFVRVLVEGTMLASQGIQMVTVPFAFRAVTADTAQYALDGAGGGGSNGWVDDGSVVRLESATDKVGIGNTNPGATLTVGETILNTTDTYVTVGSSSTGSGFAWGEDPGNFGYLSWSHLSDRIFIGQYDAGNHFYGLSLYRGNVGIGLSNDYPEEPLVIGKTLGAFGGHRLVIGDDRAGLQTGLVIGEDSNNRAWSLWDVDNDYFAFGTKESGTIYGNTMVLGGGGVGFNIEPAAYTVLRIDKQYNTTSTRYGIVTHVKNSSSADMFGTWSKAEQTIPTTPMKNIYGLYGIGEADSTGIDGPRTVGVKGYGSGGTVAIGVYGEAAHAYDQQAGHFEGRVDIHGRVNVYGTLYKTGGSFKIDHPLDPEGKYLLHSFVESPDMMNIYNGNVVLDDNGEAVVEMPDWFEPLNRDFRYQLTCIGGFEPVYVAEEMRDGRFLIAGGRPGLKVSWQVTGIRHDRWAEENRIPVEMSKTDKDRGRYIHPELYGANENQRIDHDLRSLGDNEAPTGQE